MDEFVVGVLLEILLMYCVDEVFFLVVFFDFVVVGEYGFVIEGDEIGIY